MIQKKDALSDESYLRGILEKDPLILRKIYQHFFKGVAKYVIEHGGNQQDAEDIFQDAMVVLYRKIKANKLTLSSSFYTYLFGVCKLIWLNKKTKASKAKVIIPVTEIKEEMASGEDLEPVLEKTEKYRFFREKFKLLGEDCQKVLNYFFKGVKLKEVAVLMGFSSEGYAKKKKFECKKKLIQLIQGDSRFSDFKM